MHSRDTADYYTLTVKTDKILRDGSSKITLHTDDRYSRRRYALERRAVLVFSGILNGYLKKRPHISADARRNLARRLVYVSPAIRAWAQYMPGGFATFYVHNPSRLHMMSGKRIDYVARILFRHSIDGQGLRSRAYAMTWFVKNHVASHKHINWLSVACGTGQPTFDAAQVIKKPTHYMMVDSNLRAIEFAHELAGEYDVSDDDIETLHLDAVRDHVRLAKMLRAYRPDVIDAMGLFEYLSVDDAIELLRHLYGELPIGGVLVFTNMLPSHPHLDLHRRGLGWPGVIQRNVPQMRRIMKHAGIPADQVTVMLPDDKVYGIYGVIKK